MSRIRYQRETAVIIDNVVRGHIYYPTKRGQDYVLYGTKLNLLWRASSLSAMKRFIAANYRSPK
jgi:hypothetical protein